MRNRNLTISTWSPEFLFPFLVWQRKSDLDSSVFKAQNQLALPIIKALDIHDSLEANDIPVFGLITYGASWQLWIGYLYPHVNEDDIKVRLIIFSLLIQYVLRPCLQGEMDSFMGSLRFFRLLANLSNFFKEHFEPCVLNRLRDMKLARQTLAEQGAA